jgi:carboxylesterase type B
MGESAGAGSMTYQLVFTGSGPTPNTPFKKVIIQSPAWVHVPDSPSELAVQDATYKKSGLESGLRMVLPQKNKKLFWERGRNAS